MPLQLGLGRTEWNAIAGDIAGVHLGFAKGRVLGGERNIWVLLFQGLQRGSILLGQALREAGEHHEQKGNERNRAADEREATARCGDFSDC